MEPVSLALGVLPLLGGAIKAYKSAHKKFKVFRHYSREIARLRKHIDRQRQFFVNESHLLLRAAIDDEAIIESMLEDAEHARWRSKWLESRLREHLAKNYAVCQDIVIEIEAAMGDLQQELRCFDELALQRHKASPTYLTVSKSGPDSTKIDQGLTCRRTNLSRTPYGASAKRPKLYGTRASLRAA